MTPESKRPDTPSFGWPETDKSAAESKQSDQIDVVFGEPLLPELLDL